MQTEELMSDWLLVSWLLIAFAWDVLVFGFFSYIVFWRGRSGWWYVLAAALTYTPTLYKALHKRYGIPEDED